MRGQRGLRGLAAAITLVAMVGALPAVPAWAETEYDPNVTVVVEGSYHASTSDYLSPGNGGDSCSAELKWSETVTAPIRSIQFGEAPTFTAEGQVEAKVPSHPSAECSGSLSPKGGSIIAVIPPGSGGSSIEVDALAPLNGHLSSSSSNVSCQPGGYTMTGGETAGNDAYVRWLVPKIETYAGAGPVSETFSFTASGKSGSGTGQSEGTETLSFFGAPEIPGTSPPSKGEPSPSKTEPPASTKAQREAAERRRRELKEQARADLAPALRDAWSAHGLSAVIGLAGSLALGAVADDIGGAAALYQGNDATIRAINDYRIVNDPPAPEYRLLAAPVAAKTPSLRSCRGFKGARGGYCKALRTAESKLLTVTGMAGSDDAAMETTIDRDSAAIAAGDYAAAESQATHFESLRTAMLAALSKQGRAGAAVAALLKRARVPGKIGRAKAIEAIGWLERRLERSGIDAAAIGPLAGGALTAGPTDLLVALTTP